MDLYWEALRHRVCRKCIDGNGKGSCRLPVEETCALEAFFPELVMIVSTVNADTYEAYVDALRNSICTQCDHQLPDGTCHKRETLECALDRYYPVVIEVIESVKESMERGGVITMREV